MLVDLYRNHVVAVTRNQATNGEWFARAEKECGCLGKITFIAIELEGIRSTKKIAYLFRKAAYKA